MRDTLQEAPTFDVTGRFDSQSESAAVIDASRWAAAEPNIAGCIVQDAIRISKGQPGQPGVFVVPIFITAFHSDLSVQDQPQQQLEFGGAA